MDNYKTAEREEYIEKLESQITSVDRILSMDSGTVLNTDLKNKLRALKKEAATVLRKLKNNEFEIAVVGLEKAGKSTFANALIENSLLPAAGPRCTFTSTQIEYSGDNKEDSAIVSFYSLEEFNRDFKEKLEKIGFSNSDRYDFDTIDEGTYLRFYESDQISEEKKKAWGDIHEDIRAIIKYSSKLSELLGKPDMMFSSGEINSGKLNEYITKEDKARAVRQVVISSDQLSKMPNAVIFDVPGFNSPTELHKIQTRERMKSADAIIVVADGEHPSITGESLKILRESDDDGNPLNDKLFVFANKIDQASDIPGNISKTYDEWISKGFVPGDKKHRIIFGSAVTHLISAGKEKYNTKEKNESVLQSYERIKDQLPTGDGIETIRNELEKYNRNERFEVLKRRINRISADIVRSFGDIRREYSDTGLHKSYGSEHLALVTDLIDDIRPDAEKNLLTLKEDIRIYMPEEKPLSKQITKYITDNVTTEKYSISDEVISEARKRSPYVGTFEDTARIEDEVRKLKFKEMYNDFCSNVINIADKHHVEYAEQILKTIMSSMKIESDSPYYKELESLLRTELSDYRNELISESDSEIYYQSLIERFSRDIYEILITSQYNSERLRKFYDSIDNYFSMSVFYRSADCGNELEYIDRTPQEQPFCMMLLFHHYLNFIDNLRSLVSDISRITGVKIPEDAVKMAEKAFSALGGDKESLIDKIDESIKSVRDKTDEFKHNRIMNVLNDVYESNEPCSLADREEFTLYYERYHSSLRGGKQYSVDDFRTEFDKDIILLSDILVNAFVRAVDLEKPFVARETKSIDEIIDYIKSKKFAKFITSNFWKIKYQESERLDKTQREHEQNVAIMGEINNILNEIEN